MVTGALGLRAGGLGFECLPKNISKKEIAKTRLKAAARRAAAAGQIKNNGSEAERNFSGFYCDFE